MIYIVDKNGRIAYKAMWTDHEEIASVLTNLVLADELQAQGVRLKPFYTERINYIPAEYAGGLREKVFDRAGPKAWADYQKVFAGLTKQENWAIPDVLRRVFCSCRAGPGIPTVNGATAVAALWFSWQ